MRRLALGLGLLALSACARTTPPDRIFAVYFTDFSSTLDRPATEVVANAAALSKRFPLYVVRVSGYADSAGSPQKDVDISRARAIGHPIRARRCRSRPGGARHPAGCSAACRRRSG